MEVPINRRSCLRTIAASLTAPSLSVLARPAPTFANGKTGGTLRSTPSVTFQGGQFVDGSGRPVFVLGANYEGPADRAWRMWEDNLFDPDLISRDMAHANAANLSVLRIFVRGSLAADLWAGRWAKLDQVLDLADRHDLKLIITLADYPEKRLASVVQLDVALASRYRSRPTILAYDLKNEPHFGNLAHTEYPPGVYVPLQTIAYVRILTAYIQFFQQGLAWAAARHATIVHYFQSPESAAWTPLKNALDQTFGAWLKPQLDGIRAVDPGRPLTVGQADPVIASLSVNDWLDFRTLHCYPPATDAGVASCLALFDAVRATVPNRPLILEEFGISNADADEQRSAALEVAIVRGVCAHGGVGACKWMLNDFPKGFNARQDAFGMYRGDGTAKPVVAAFDALGVLHPTWSP